MLFGSFADKATVNLRQVSSSPLLSSGARALRHP
jgi:hypothetical protein